MRAVIYARYSSDLQAETSIEDQIRLCREHIEKEHYSIAHTYADYAISGSSLHNRPGMRSLMNDAKSGRFDIVVAEALARLSEVAGEPDAGSPAGELEGPDELESDAVGNAGKAGIRVAEDYVGVHALPDHLSVGGVGAEAVDPSPELELGVQQPPQRWSALIPPS